MRASLVSQGFKHAYGSYTRPVSGTEVRGWVGLNREVDRASRRLWIQPHVGVLDPPVQALIGQFFPQAKPAGAATVGVDIGLVGDPGTPLSWAITDETLGEQVAEIAETIDRIGVPFFERLARDPLLTDEAIARFHPQKEGLLPAHRLVYGRLDEAEEYVRGVIDTMDSTSPPSGPNSYREFATRVLNEIDARRRLTA